MKHIRKIGQVAAVASASALVLAACSGSSGGSGSDSGSGGGAGEVTWTTWGTPDELKAFEEINDKFREEYPDVKLVFQPVASYSDYHSKLTTQLTSKTAPDVFYVGDDHIANLVANDVLEPIDTCLSKEGATLALDDFNPEIYQIAQKDDVTYALPNDVNPDAFWYSKKALEAAGITEDPAELAANDEWTFDKFFEMTEKMEAEGIIGAAFWNYWATWQTILSSNGTPAYDEAGAFVGDTPEAVEALQQWADHFVDGSLAIADVMPAGSDADTLLVTDKLGFMVQGRYTVGTIEGAGMDINEYDVVRWPTASGAEEPVAVAASFLAINKDAKDKDAACDFFQMFLNSEGQTIRLADNGNALPSISGIDNIVTDSGKPANVESLILMRDSGFSNNATEAAVPGLSTDISETIMLPLFQGKIDATDALSQVSELLKEKGATE